QAQGRRPQQMLVRRDFGWPREGSAANFGVGVSAHADELGPDACENRGNQHIVRAVAERAAILAHRRAETAEFVLAGHVEKARQDCERSSYKIHLNPPVKGSISVASTANGGAGHRSPLKAEPGARPFRI